MMMTLADKIQELKLEEFAVEKDMSTIPIYNVLPNYLFYNCG